MPYQQKYKHAEIINVNKTTLVFLLASMSINLSLLMNFIITCGFFICNNKFTNKIIKKKQIRIEKKTIIIIEK